MTILVVKQLWIIAIKEIYLPPHVEILSYHFLYTLFLIPKLFGKPDNGNNFQTYSVTDILRQRAILTTCKLFTCEKIIHLFLHLAFSGFGYYKTYQR